MRAWWSRLFGNFFLKGSEIGRVVVLLPLLVGVSLLVILGERATPSEITIVTDTIHRTIYKYDTVLRERYGGEVAAKSESREAELFEFNPNTVTIDELVRLGFSVAQAEVIINYRNAGARFRSVQDFARCYTVSEEMFARLEPYIRILPSERLQPLNITKAVDTTLLIRTKDSLERVADSLAKLTLPIEINSADSARLVSVRGIGPLTASRIIRYRDLLGGYHSPSQLSEIVGMTERNYAMILQQICVDSCKIRKIDINFASPKSMATHPYISSRVLARLIKNRQLKGGWRTIEELEQSNILSAVELMRLRPYIVFGMQDTLSR